MWSRDINTVFTLRDCLLGAVKLTKNAEQDNYSYSRYDIGFDSCSLFSILNSLDKHVVIFAVGNCSSIHTDNKKKKILIFR